MQLGAQRKLPTHALFSRLSSFSSCRHYCCCVGRARELFLWSFFADEFFRSAHGFSVFASGIRWFRSKKSRSAAIRTRGEVAEVLPGEMLRRRAVQIGLATLCTGIGASSYVVSNDEGARRSLQFWKGVFPIYLHYRSVQLLSRDLGILEKERADQEFDKLHEMYTDKICSIVYTMRGFYLKQAQLMSCQDDFVPPAYMRWVKDTQDRVPSDFPGTMAREYVRKVLAEEQGMDFDEVFSKWDDTPLGVASIGQVHKAVLRKTGEVVAVKFLVPGIETKFRSDIRTLKAFCQLAMPQHVSAFDEIEKQFCTGACCSHPTCPSPSFRPYLPGNNLLTLQSLT